MKYKEGDKVLVKSLEWYNDKKNKYGRIDCSEMVFFESNMSKFCGSILTIKGVDIDLNAYVVKENICYWTDDMFEGLAEEGIYDEEFKNAINAAYNACLDDYNEVPDKIKISQVFISDKNYQDKVELCLGDDYEIVVDGGRTFVQKKKPKYPTTYEECRKVLGIDEEMIVQGGWYKHSFIRDFYKLLICRDAYWKIAGNWKPDYDNIRQEKWGTTKNFALPFPNKEILDTFNENFKDLIEKCENNYERSDV